MALLSTELLIIRNKHRNMFAKARINEKNCDAHLMDRRTTELWADTERTKSKQTIW